MNGATKIDTCLLPRMNDCIDRLEEARVVSAFYSLCEYCQKPIKGKANGKNSFTSHLDNYHKLCISSGLQNAPATFQRALDVILFKV